MNELGLWEGASVANLMAFLARKIGIDLGTTNTLVFLPDKGIVVNEPSVVAVDENTHAVLAVGKEAKEMVGRTPTGIIAYKPMKKGVIADYQVTESMLRYFIRRALGWQMFLRPDVIVSVPAGITSAERRAVIKATKSAGARAAFVIKEPVLAALGAGIPIHEASGHMIVNIGGGTSEIAVISLGGIVVSASVRVGGTDLDQAIIDYVRKKHNLAIGETTAEQIKISIGSAMALEDEEVLEIRGRDLIQGLPRYIEVSSNEITQAIYTPLQEIMRGIHEVLQQTPPELSADIMDKGMIISGGGALLKNIDKFITKVTQVPAFRAEKPLFCVAFGTGIALDNLETYRRSLLNIQ